MSDHPNYRLELDPTLAFTHAALRTVKDYWQRKCGDRLMPARADIDPLDLREQLGWLILTDVVGPPLRFRYRLVGSAITAELGRDSTGKYLDEIYPEAIYKDLAGSFGWVVANRQPLRVVGNLWPSERRWLTFETLDLPLSQNGADVNMILTRAVISIRKRHTAA